MPVVQSNGVALNVQTLGQGERTVVMVHGGWVDNLATWYMTCAPALAATHRVLLYDLRGHGQSERTNSGYGLRSMAADLAGLVEADDADRVSVVGFSFGGAVAIRHAVDYPETIDRVVAIEATLPVGGQGMMDWALSHTREDWLEWIPASVRDRFADGSRQLRKREEQATALVTETNAIADALAEPDILDAELAQLTMPVLLCYGTDTPLPDTRDRLERVMPGSRLQTFEGTHFLPIERPTELSAAIGAFLDA